jgi:hypothetical protein
MMMEDGCLWNCVVAYSKIKSCVSFAGDDSAKKGFMIFESRPEF